MWCETLEKPPCVRSKRPRVCWHRAYMLKHMCPWCRQTRGRFERTHEVHGRGSRRQPRILHRENKQKMNILSFIVSSAYHEWPTCYHLHKRFRHLMFEGKLRTTCRCQAPVVRKESLEGTSCEMVRLSLHLLQVYRTIGTSVSMLHQGFSCRCVSQIIHTQKHTQHTYTRNTHTKTQTHTHTHMYMHMYMYLYMYM